MRPRFALLVLPALVAACQSPKPTPAVAAPPPPAPPPAAPLPPPRNAEVQGPLASQCQGLFVRSLAGETATFSAPTVTVDGPITTIRIAGTSADPTRPPLAYICTFRDSVLVSSGRA